MCADQFECFLKLWSILKEKCYESVRVECSRSFSKISPGRVHLHEGWLRVGRATRDMTVEQSGNSGTPSRRPGNPELPPFPWQLGITISSLLVLGAEQENRQILELFWDQDTCLQQKTELWDEFKTIECTKPSFHFNRSLPWIRCFFLDLEICISIRFTVIHLFKQLSIIELISP